MILIAVTMLVLTAVDGKPIEVAPDQIVTLRIIREYQHDHVHSEANCQVNTTDGKYITVKETCDKIHELIGR